MPRIGPAPSIRFTFDGETIEAVPGETIASAIAASGRLAIARSPKFHRPRGPACFRAACDGCLARVAGEPNVMTCRTIAAAGVAVESQNTLGSRNVDLLRLTDWFFPNGMNHHELFAGIVGVQKVMQIFARRVAGLGHLPAEPRAPRQASRRSVDVLVIGGGPSGMAIAARLSKRGRKVTLADDGVALGGSILTLAGDSFEDISSAFEQARKGIDVLDRATVIGCFGDDFLVVSPTETVVLTAKDVVVAAGAHDGVLAFDGNDLPGVMSARAAGEMLRHGSLPGENIVVVVAEGGGPFGEAYAKALEGRNGVAVELVRGEPAFAKGTSRVRAVVVAVKGKTREIRADAVLVDAPRAPSYELAEQLGATVKHEPRGYRVVAPGGVIRKGVWAIGEVVGTKLDPKAISAEADALSAAIA